MLLRDIAPGVVADPAGYWVVPGDSEGRYPEGGSDFCANVEDRSFWFAHRNRVIVSLVRRYTPDGPLLDVGAGNGFVANALSAAGFFTVAIEPSAEGARNAVARAVPHVVRGVLPSPAFAARAAGGIGLFDVIEHTPDDHHFLESLRPYLKDRGFLYLTVPAYSWLWSREDVAAGHYRRYTMLSVRRVLQSAGYELVYGTYIFWWLPLPLVLFRKLGDMLRRGREYETPATTHSAGSAWVRRLLQATLAPEAAAVSRGISIPSGGSILAVARKTS
jgi:SAM-dependent methyltransferase